ncbi:MAG: rhombotarget lipoprotein [Pseudomonadota bacterium]
MIRHLSVVGLMLTLLAIAGCTNLWQTMQGEGPRQGTSSSLVDFLYPKGERPPPQDNIVPTLRTPLRVGLAFVPSNSPNVQGLSEARKEALLNTAKQSFLQRESISEIVNIPDTYLRSSRGFDTIDQVARLYNLDVIALVSYDQVAITDDTRASLLYWTIIGAYTIKGSRNDVQTFVDTSIFDVATRKLLFRAAGTNVMSSTSTLVNSTTETRKAREESFALAMADMANNLADEYNRFEARIKQDKSVIVASRSGGAGSMGVLSLLVLLTAVLLRQRRRAT